MVKENLPKVIAVTSGKGGVGKTNVVANLAVSLAMTGKNVLVLDADLGLGNLDVLLGLAPKFNIGHLIRGEKTLQEIIINGPQGIKILSAASGIQELTNLSMEQKINLFSQLMMLNGQIDVLLIDTAAGISQNVLFFNIASQEIIVIASSEPTSIIDAYALIKVLYLNYGEKRFRLLVNLVNNDKEGLEVYRNISLVAGRYLNVSIDYLGFIPFDENMPRAVREQRALVELFPDSKANKDFVELAKFVNELPPPVLKDNIQFFVGKFRKSYFVNRSLPFTIHDLPYNMDRETLIIKHAPLVKIIALRLAIRLPPHIDIDDLISVGIRGLIEAIDRFDPARGVKMETYLSFRIKGVMLDELRKMDWVPRSVRGKAKQLEKEYLKVEARLGRTPTEEEMAESLGMESEELQRFLQEASGMAVLSLEDMGFGEDGSKRNIIECIADPNGEDPVAHLNLKETRRFLARGIDELSEKERLVLSLYYYEDLNLKEIGKVLGVTESRICQLHSQAVFKLKGKLRRLRV